MYIVLLRTIILYIVVIITMRIMGKRQIGQLQPFELVIAIMISELASLPMQDTRIPLTHGVIPIITLLVLQVTISVIQLKSQKAHEIISGKPSILIKNGKIDVDELHYNKFNIADLLEEVRLGGYYNLEDIEYAILETNGQISIIPKTELSPASKKDMNIQSQQDKLPITLILDGSIQTDNLKMIKKDEKWLMDTLHKNNIQNPEDAFIALLDSQSKFFYQLKDKRRLKP